jgi:predicted amidohydrolase
MRDIRFAAAQFEHRDADKDYNLGRIRELTRRAVEQGAEFVCFHECATVGYSVMQAMSRAELEAWSEPVPTGRRPGA